MDVDGVPKEKCGSPVLLQKTATYIEAKTIQNLADGEPIYIFSICSIIFIHFRVVASLRCRGKLYILSEDSAWQEAGIGHASILGAGTQRRLQFKAEDSGKVLHDRPVFASDVYQLQGEGERKTIIVWEDQEDQKDWAGASDSCCFATILA